MKTKLKIWDSFSYHVTYRASLKSEDGHPIEIIDGKSYYLGTDHVLSESVEDILEKLICNLGDYTPEEILLDFEKNEKVAELYDNHKLLMTVELIKIEQEYSDGSLELIYQE